MKLFICLYYRNKKACPLNAIGFRHPFHLKDFKNHRTRKISELRFGIVWRVDWTRALPFNALAFRYQENVFSQKVTNCFQTIFQCKWNDSEKTVAIAGRKSGLLCSNTYSDSFFLCLLIFFVNKSRTHPSFWVREMPRTPNICSSNTLYHLNEEICLIEAVPSFTLSLVAACAVNGA